MFPRFFLDTFLGTWNDFILNRYFVIIIVFYVVRLLFVWARSQRFTREHWAFSGLKPTRTKTLHPFVYIGVLFCMILMLVYHIRSRYPECRKKLCPLLYFYQL